MSEQSHTLNTLQRVATFDVGGVQCEAEVVHTANGVFLRVSSSFYEAGGRILQVRHVERERSIFFDPRPRP